MNSIRTRITSALLATGLVLGAASTVVLAGTTPVSAASGDAGRISQTTPMRSCADTRCNARATVPAGTSVPVRCWRDAGSALGTNRWFRISYGGTSGFVSANAVAQQPQVPYCSDMLGGETLFAGQSVWSHDGRFRLVMQGDGNLVEYGPNGALWSTMTAGRSGAKFVQQSDGNGVVYDASGRAVWANMTLNPGSRLVVQDDANIVTYVGSTPLYATNQHRWNGQQLRPAGSPNPGEAGNCTWYAEKRIMEYMRRGRYPAWGGNAGWWDDNARGVGWPVQGMPTSHSIVVFEPNTNGMSSLGHVAWVDAVQKRSDGVWVHVAEMNVNGWNVVSSRWVKHAAGMSYIPAPSL